MEIKLERILKTQNDRNDSANEEQQFHLFSVHNNGQMHVELMPLFDKYVRCVGT